MPAKTTTLTFLERRFWAISFAVLALMGLAMVTSALDESQTWDEGIHAAIGYSYWTTGDYHRNPEHPALGKMLLTLPLYLWVHPNLDTNSKDWEDEKLERIGIDFLYKNRVSPETILFACRFVNIGLTLVFGLYVAWWTKRRFGAAVALAALTFLAFDPNFIANGRYVTTDVLAAATIFLACTVWIEYLAAKTPRWLVLSGLTLGVAFASKYSSLYLAAVLPVMYWVIPGRPARIAVRRFLVACLMLAVLATAVIAVVYLPEVIHPDPYIYLKDRLTGRGFAGSVLLSIARRVPVRPLHFIVGIDRVSEFNQAGHAAYLLGRFSEHGWWYYFPVAFAVKTPAAVLAGVLIALWMAAIIRRRLRPHFRMLLLLAMPPVTYFAISMVAGINVGMRHLLPVFPFLYVLMACVLVEAARAVRWMRWVLPAILLVTGIESAAAYPNYLAFFNFAAGGPSAGPRYLLDSNLDWGQAFKKAGRYVRTHGIQRVCLFTFGNGAPERYFDNAAPLDVDHLNQMDCVAAISATPLHGLYTGPEMFAVFRARKPIAVIGHSIYLYDLRKRESGR